MKNKGCRLGLGFLLLSVVACSTSPTGRRQLLLYSDNDVAQLGLTSFDQIKKETKVSKNAKQTKFVQCVAKAVTDQIPAQYSNRPAKWEVVLFDDPQINAFALPGGRIGVYRGLLGTAKGPDQLAAVIGHEVSHVLAKHSNERLSQSQVANLGMVAADMALGSSGYRQPAMAALGVGVQVGVLLPYGREQETEADLLGLSLMANAGFDPRQAVTLWQNMAQSHKGKQQPELLSTHPSDGTRIRAIQQLLPKVMPLYQAARQAGRTPTCQ
ncbi:M48 family metallopeptidase [Pseudaeromonas sp. ZJS20]|uniref:M48 family metallopeptidase n=1 Tax=Pseudaeromonas aegiceratis TaxID=3153928 RepID=UPI00390C4DF1